MALQENRCAARGKFRKEQTGTNSCPAVKILRMKQKNKEQYKRIISFFSTLLILGLLTLEFAFVWYVAYSDKLLLPFYRRGHWLMILVYALLTLTVSQASGGYKIGYLKRSDVLYTQSIASVIVNAITYAQVCLIGRQLLSPIPLIILTGVDMILLAAWSYLSSCLYFRLYPPRKLIIVYGSKAAAQLVLKMSMRVDKYMICESIDIAVGLDKIKEELARYEGVIICDISGADRNDIVKYCFEESKRAYISPKISDIILRGADEIRLFDTPLLLCRNSGPSAEQRFAKRAMDLLICIPALVLFSPVMLACAIAIKAHDGGPVLYRQTRLTIGGREFEVMKFRSMVLDAEKDGKPRLATEDDDRITPVGRFLRKCRLDELPQLINIIRGDMSIVGPRPERPELTEEYSREIPEFRFRLKVKAGLTGYAQVTGVYDTSPFDKLKMDLMYIERYSILLDLRIMLMTVKTMLLPGQTNEEQQIYSVVLPQQEETESDTERKEET